MAAAARERTADVILELPEALRSPVGSESPASSCGPRDHEEEHESRMCTVCMDQPVTTVAMPCRHALLCIDCMREVRKRSGFCPVCRSEITAAYHGHFESEFVDLDVEVQEVQKPRRGLQLHSPLGRSPLARFALLRARRAQVV